MEAQDRLQDGKEVLAERTLARIAECANSRHKVYTFGVVVDLSEPFQVLEDQNYTTKIKVIDPTFNYNETIENEEIRFQNYAYIYVYAKTPDILPRIAHIGDIIRLRRFNFFVNDKGELTGHAQSYSNWMTFDVTEKNSITIQSCMQLKKNETRTLTKFEEDKIKSLRKWVFKFFENHSIRSIVWWSKAKMPVDDSLVVNSEIEGIDLVLCTKKVFFEKQKIEFVDEEQKKYILYLQANPVLHEGQVIKLRSIKVHFSKEGRVILLTNKSSCMIIPNGFFDQKLFNQDFYLMNKDAIRYRSPRIRKRGNAGNFETRRSVLEVYPFLEDYYFEDHLVNRKDLIKISYPKKIYSNQASIIKKEFNNKLPSVLASFINIPRQNDGDIKYQKFVVSVNIDDIKQRTFEEMVFTFCETCNASQKIGQTGKFTCCDKILNICIILCLKLSDESLDNGKTVSAFIVTKQTRNNPFLLWNILPGMDDYRSWSVINEQEFTNFQSKLEALKNYQDKIRMVLEVKETKTRKLFFEVTDTLFLP
jgi:hypothetical protein